MRTIHRYAAVGLLLLTVILSASALSQAQAPPTAAAARVVLHLVGRIFLNPVNGTGVVVAYATDIEGVPGPFFNGAPSETTAYFTLKTDAISLQFLPNNGDITLAIANPGESIFHPQPEPHLERPQQFCYWTINRHLPSSPGCCRVSRSLLQ